MLQQLLIPIKIFLGLIWTAQTNSGLNSWLRVSISSDASIILALINGTDYPKISTDGGSTWSNLTSAGSRDYLDCDISADGQVIVLVINTTAYFSTDAGASWATRAASPNFTACAVSGDGTTILLCPASSWIHRSTDSGTSWTVLNSTSPLLHVFDCDINYDGQVMVFAGTSGLAVSTNGLSGSWPTSFTYIAAFSGKGITNCSVADSTGDIIIANSPDRSLHISNDYGANWSSYTPSGSLNLTTVAVSGDGNTFIYAESTNKYIYVSIDKGSTWVDNSSSPYSAGLRGWADSAIDELGTKYVAVASSSSYVMKAS